MKSIHKTLPRCKRPVYVIGVDYPCGPPEAESAGREGVRGLAGAAPQNTALR